MDDDKDINKPITDAYYFPSGYASMTQTLEDARKKNKTINMSDVEAWFAEHVLTTTQVKRQSSYIPPEANFVFEVDLCFSNQA